MSNTYRKDRFNKVFKESLKKKDSDAHYRCRCEYCLCKKDSLDKIAEKELRTELLKGDEYEEPFNYAYCECEMCVPYKTHKVDEVFKKYIINHE